MADIFKLNPKGTLQTVLFSEPSATPGSSLSLLQMADLVLGVGLRNDPAAEAIAVAYALSGFDPAYVRVDTLQGMSYVGLWGTRVSSQRSPQFSSMQDPYRSAEFMNKKSSNGTSWLYWPEVSETGSLVGVRYRSMLSNAKTVVDSKGGYN